MTILRKAATGSLKAAGEEGVAVAVFSRFGGPPDSDGDITEPGAFTSGVTVPVSPWNHSTYIATDLPAGKATIRVYRDRAEAEVEFFMDTIAGRETYRTLKALGGSEWSYGFTIQKSHADFWKQQPVRVLEKVDIFEVSPVIRGAGRDTTTVSLRSAPMDEALRRECDRARRLLSQPDPLDQAYADAFRREYGRYLQLGA